MNDISKIIENNLIKNGTIITGCQKTGVFLKYDKYVNNNPTIDSIENKFDNRFDDPSYYYGLGNSTIVGG